MRRPTHRVGAARPLAMMIFAICAFSLRESIAADRSVEFRYAFSVTGLTPGRPARIWIPEATSDAAQDVTVVSSEFPAGVDVASGASALNRMSYLRPTAGPDGTIAFAVTYRVTRREIDESPVRAGEDVAADLKPDRLVPVGGKPARLLAGRPRPTGDRAKARDLFDLVFDYMTYSKDRPGWGRGDVNWACDSRFGNCSDFHSLFLSLCRTEGMPAKMEFGFLLPAADQSPASQPSAGKFNYHCWAYFKPADASGWVPLDISKAKNRPSQKDEFFGHLDADRVRFSTGRDLVLTPPQDGPPLNFVIYPYVEVDGRPWPEEKLVRSISVTPQLPTTPQAVAPSSPRR